MITPQPGVVLVSLAASNYGNQVYLPEKSYDSITSGTILAINPEDKVTFKVGDTEYHRLYKDDCRVKGDNGEKTSTYRN